VATVPQVLALAKEVGERWRALVLLAAFCSLRFGELAALTRADVDIEEATVTVRVSVSDLPGGVRHLGPPKSDAGRRVVTMPAAIVPAIEEHLERFAQPGDAGLVFVGPLGGVLRESNFVNDIWHKATAAQDLAHLHFHDLRHTGNTLAAATGASLRELMVRMGHASPKAALRYQHATRDRDAAIARALSDLVEQAQPAQPTTTTAATDRNAPQKTVASGPTVARRSSSDRRRTNKTASDLGRRSEGEQGTLNFPS
jgi:integrase